MPASEAFHQSVPAPRMTLLTRADAAVPYPSEKAMHMPSPRHSMGKHNCLRNGLRRIRLLAPPRRISRLSAGELSRKTCPSVLSSPFLREQTAHGHLRQRRRPASIMTRPLVRFPHEQHKSPFSPSQFEAHHATRHLSQPARTSASTHPSIRHVSSGRIIAQRFLFADLMCAALVFCSK